MSSTEPNWSVATPVAEGAASKTAAASTGTSVAQDDQLLKVLRVRFLMKMWLGFAGGLLASFAMFASGQAVVGAALLLAAMICLVMANFHHLPAPIGDRIAGLFDSGSRKAKVFIGVLIVAISPLVYLYLDTQMQGPQAETMPLFGLGFFAVVGLITVVVGALGIDEDGSEAAA